MAKKEPKKEPKKDTIISTIEEFIVWTNTLPETGSFIFRGQADESWPLRSGAARRLFKDGDPIVANQIIRYTENLIERTRNKGLHHHHRTLDSDLEILAELQHNGAATPLLDFSRNALAALWMACCSEDNKDGRVFAIDNSPDFEQITNRKIRKKIRILLDDDKIRIWEPPGQNERICAQGSFFLLARESYDDSTLKLCSIKIAKGRKVQILKYLERIHGLSEENIYPDFSGFARANAADKPIRNKDTASLFRIARDLHQKSKFKEAIAYYDYVINIDASNSEFYFYRGNAKRAGASFAESIKDYDEAIKLNRNYIFAYVNRGIVKKALEKHAEAIEDYDKAIELNPDYALAYNNRGNAKQALKHYAEAIEDYDKAIELNPDYASAYYNRGNAKQDLEKHAEAIEDYDKAIELNPDYASAYYNRGNAKQALKHYAEAIEDYDKAIELNPDYALAYNNRGNAKQALKHYAEAIEDYDKAIELNPDYASAYYNRGNAKQALKHYAEAIEDYDKAIELNPDYALAYNNRGKVYFAISKKIEARQDYEKALKLAKAQNDQKVIGLASNNLVKLNK